MRHRRLLSVFVILVALAPARYICAQTPGPVPAAPPSTQMAPHEVYAGGLQNAWQDWGWAHRTLAPKQPARLDFSKYAGWRLAHRNLAGTYSDISFALRAPAAFGSFLEVRLGANGAGEDAFAKVPVQATAGADGWATVQIPMAALNPQNLPFDTLLFRAKSAVGSDPVYIDHIVLHPGIPVAAAPAAPNPRVPVKLRILCRAPQHAISPKIYGIAFSPRHAGRDPAPFALQATIRRWGGNPASRYNPKLGNAWNTASDWFFTNVNYTNKADYSWRDFLAENAEHDMQAAMTVPTLGWVAKDTSTPSFSVSALGAQKYHQGDAGNGIGPDGKKLPSPDAHTTSIEASPAFVGQWVAEMEAYMKAGHPQAIGQYILDNEPALWNSTHRDVHPEALTYDELLNKTIAYGEAVRRAAPQTDIAGPAEWGWPAYFFSAKDAEVGFRQKPDRRAHGDEPLLAWYLRKLKEREQKSGIRVLDTVDLHYYPQISGVYGHGEQTSPPAAARRLRATRSLWDPTYKDESWIADTIELLPRMQKLIAENYPGRKISIGEYNFGGEQHISGALALAETLGRFGQYGVYSAYSWTYPPKGSFAAQAFLAYRNFDGKGGHFLEKSVKTEMAPQVSLFASADQGQQNMVAIALNLRDNEDVDADIELVGCGAYTKVTRYSLDATGANLHADADAKSSGPAGKSIQARLPAYSLSVLQLEK